MYIEKNKAVVFRQIGCCGSGYYKIKTMRKKTETDTNVLHKTQINYKGITQAIKKNIFKIEQRKMSLSYLKLNNVKKRKEKEKKKK